MRPTSAVRNRGCAADAPRVKALGGVAVEIKEPRGRCRMEILTDASAATLHPFVTRHVEPGARVVTDGWSGYLGIDRLGYVHEPRSQRAARLRGEDPGELLPAVHRVASLARRWLLGTHQGSVEKAHLPSYLNESSSGSTVADPAPEAWSSTACWSWPSRTPRCATATWSSTHSRSESRPARPATQPSAQP